MHQNISEHQRQVMLIESLCNLQTAEVCMLYVQGHAVHGRASVQCGDIHAWELWGMLFVAPLCALLSFSVKLVGTCMCSRRTWGYEADWRQGELENESGRQQQLRLSQKAIIVNAFQGLSTHIASTGTSTLSITSAFTRYPSISSGHAGSTDHQTTAMVECWLWRSQYLTIVA